MVIDIASLDLKERPILSLENLDETPIAILGNAFNIEAHIAYNEMSSITFDLPAYVEGVKTPEYDKVVGTRLIRFDGWGVFILVNPETTGDGIKEIKSCKAYSREYEFTYKKMSLEENTYNLWNPVTPDSTILGIALSYLPYWSVGEVDSDLIGKYRTFSESNVNIYNFLKNTVQTKYGCIVDFDTVNRRINLRSTANHATTKPVFLSYDNLVKEIEREEDTENIFTCLDVNGADGVTIRGVNPTGTNKIYNLDYYMNQTNFSQAFINKWEAWKTAFDVAQPSYHLLTIERMLKTSEIVFAQSEVDDTGNAELKALEAQRSVYIELLARSAAGSSDYQRANVMLNGGTWQGTSYNGLNNDISAKQTELATKRSRVSVLEAEKEAITAELVAINQSLAFESFFTASEIMLLKQYFKEDSITDSSFVYAEAKNYDAEDVAATLTSSSTFTVSNTTKELNITETGREYINCTGGTVTIGTLTASLIKASAEYNPTTHHVVFTAYLSAGSIGGTYFPDGCLTAVTDGGTFSNGDTLSFSGGSGRLYFTRNTTEYERFAVEWDLYEYGRSCLEKLAYPSYSFSLDSANFLSLDEFDAFANAIELGEKVYIDLGSEYCPYAEEMVVDMSKVSGAVAGYLSNVLSAILVGFEVDFEDLSSLKLEFGDKYCLKDAAFELADLLEKSVSMGKTVDVSRFGYNAFIDSGASTSVKDYMDSALDVSKQSILSSGDMAISWDDSGIRLRKWNAGHTGYENDQIAIINNNIVFTDDGWQSAKMAIGHFVDTNEGSSWGVVAPSVVGTLLAGENLVIESKKQDGGVAVFKVDADGAVLHNSKFDIVRANTVAPGATQTSTHILLDPDLGFGIGTYPVKNPQTGTWDTNKAKFYVDMQGNVHMSGTLDAANGYFSGTLQAATGTFSGELSAATGTFSGALSAATGTFNGIVRASDYQILKNGQYVSMQNSADQFKADYLDLKGLTITDNNGNVTFQIDSDGNVTMVGDITMQPTSTISWSQIIGDPTSNANLNAKFNTYVTGTALNTTLGSYVTNSSLSSTLGSYTTRSYLTSVLSDYVSDSDLDTALNEYISAQDLNSQLSGYALLSSLKTGTTEIAAGCIKTGQIAADRISLYGLSVYRRDASGNPLSDVSLNIDSKGNVTLGSGASISWSNVASKPNFAAVATSGSYNDLTNKPNIPENIELPSYIQSTYIDETTIQSPTIYAGKYYATGDGSASAGNGAAYYIYDGYNQSTGQLGTKVGYISYDSNGNGLDSSQRRVKFRTVGATALKIQSGLNLSIETGAWNDNNEDALNNYTIYLMSDTVMAKSVYMGSNYSWGSSLPSPASSSMGRLFFLTE